MSEPQILFVHGADEVAVSETTRRIIDACKVAGVRYIKLAVDRGSPRHIGNGVYVQNDPTKCDSIDTAIGYVKSPDTVAKIGIVQYESNSLVVVVESEEPIPAYLGSVIDDMTTP